MSELIKLTFYQSFGEKLRFVDGSRRIEESGRKRQVNLDLSQRPLQNPFDLVDDIRFLQISPGSFFLAILSVSSPP